MDTLTHESKSEVNVEPKMEVTSEIQAGIPEFFDGKSVLVTGATGFLGTLILEKLLRSCPGLRTVYTIVRTKKGHSPEARLKRIFEDPVFDQVRDSTWKVQVVTGDCGEIGLGISPEDRAMLVKEVNVVFHCAATVRFDEALRLSTHINVRGTREMVLLAKEMTNLKAFVHVSTAYSHCPLNHIEEHGYEVKMTADHLLNIVDALDDTALEKIADVLMEPWPNTYCFTKSIAEDVIVKETKGLPVSIVRPSIVINTYKDPKPGWINNVNGPSGLVVGAAIGILHTVYVENVDIVPDMIPGDVVVNAIIATAWSTATKTIDMETDKKFEDNNLPIYNCVSSTRNPITWKQFLEKNEKYGMNWPSEHCLWYYSLYVVHSKLADQMLRIFLHLLPAIIVDIFLRCIGRKPMLWSAYGKIHKYLDVTSYFGSKQWAFEDKNLPWLWTQMNSEDKKNFNFNVSTFIWDDVVKEIIPGLRMYIMKDPLHTLEQGKAKYRRLKIIHYTLIGVLWFLFLQCLWWTVSYFLK